jgi:hypothetical protein
MVGWVVCSVDTLLSNMDFTELEGLGMVNEDDVKLTDDDLADSGRVVYGPFIRAYWL